MTPRPRSCTRKLEEQDRFRKELEEGKEQEKNQEQGESRKGCKRSKEQGKHQEQDKPRKELERSRGQGKHREQDGSKKEFGKSREQGKHQEQDNFKKEWQEALGKSCRKFQEMSLQQPALIKGKEEIGQGENGTEARPSGLLHIRAPEQPLPKDL